MLRVQPSNLPKPRGNPRPRRLLPKARAPSRHEILPPPDQTNVPASELALPVQPQLGAGRERWSVRLELGDDEIAKLYGQGLTRGAVVWKKGMVEWRPLLVTPELLGLLRRTRITDCSEAAPRTPRSTEPPRAAEPPLDEMTLPALPPPPRLPDELLAEPGEKQAVPTVAPLAMDVVVPTTPRRSLELLAVGVVAFTLAWIAHAQLYPAAGAGAMATLAPSAPAAAAPACEPANGSGNATSFAGSNMPTVSITDLPLLGASSTSTRQGTRWSRHNSRSASSRDGGPSRSDLVAALSQVASVASGCGERGGPVRVVISFASSGVARSIQVSGADLPPATRSCMIGAASRARIPAFSGDPVTVSKTL
jgi:hypothetical protein